MVETIHVPKVSVCVITYNQEPYIRKCLQSIVDQETNFDFEVIVGDDCSTDGTRAIVQEFAVRYPGVVKPIFQEKNIDGGSHNFLTVHRAAKGQYIAHVDGDDYCLPGKLQKQADLLDSDKNCNIVFHRMLVESPLGDIVEEPFFLSADKLRLGRKELLRFIAIGSHSSKMYRKEYQNYQLPIFPVTDFFSNVEQVGDGYARFVGREALGVYRKGIGIAYSGFGVRTVLANSMLYFCQKYPEYRLQINTAALTYFVANIRYSLKGGRIFLRLWLKTFHFLSIPNLLLRPRLFKKG